VRRRTLLHLRASRQRVRAPIYGGGNPMGAIMLKLPPPVWTLIFLVVAAV
jgi:hypothetical protein